MSYIALSGLLAGRLQPRRQGGVGVGSCRRVITARWRSRVNYHLSVARRLWTRLSARLVGRRVHPSSAAWELRWYPTAPRRRLSVEVARDAAADDDAAADPCDKAELADPDRFGVVVTRWSHQRSYSTPAPVSVWMGDRLWTENRDFSYAIAFDAPDRAVPVGALPYCLVWRN